MAERLAASQEGLCSVELVMALRYVGAQSRQVNTRDTNTSRAGRMYWHG
jgi:hypothetical protein